MIGAPSVSTLATPSAGCSVGLRTIIAAEAEQACARQHGSALRALVLTGSLARDEAGQVTEAGRPRVLGDAEFLVVLTDGTALPDRVEAHRLARQVEEGLLGRGVVCAVTLSPIHAAYLRALRPHIFAHELRTCGRVISGQADVLGLVPEFSPAEIPLEDAWRLLCNRIVEQLDAADPAPAARYRTVKLYLDMATSLLLFAGAYEPTYRGRAERLTRLAADPAAAEAFPFPVAALARQVALCTRWKLEGLEPNPPIGITEEDAVAWARILWRWELAQLAGASPDLPDGRLIEAWMRKQPVSSRARGWLHVARRLGWLRSWRRWPRWAALARQGSPRYWVYAVAAELLFAAPGGAERDWRPLLRRLPIIRRPSTSAAALTRPEAAAEVVWSYRQLLVDTRS